MYPISDDRGSRAIQPAMYFTTHLPANFDAEEYHNYLASTYAEANGKAIYRLTADGCPTTYEASYHPNAAIRAALRRGWGVSAANVLAIEVDGEDKPVNA